MAGNVEEWTTSKYAPYPGNAMAAPAQEQIVARGGSWNSDAIMSRCTRRHARSAMLSSPARGFRVVCLDE
jgi:formylglycine-generating enzyme required for sulfatase activity